MSGSIVANAGFIDQFGDLQPDGTKALSTTWGKSSSSTLDKSRKRLTHISKYLLGVLSSYVLKMAIGRLGIAYSHHE